MIYIILVFVVIVLMVAFSIPHYASEADRQSEKIIRGKGNELRQVL